MQHTHHASLQPASGRKLASSSPPSLTSSPLSLTGHSLPMAQYVHRTRSAHQPPAGSAPYSSTLEEEGGYSEALLPWAPVDIEEEAPAPVPHPTRGGLQTHSLQYPLPDTHQLSLPRASTLPAPAHVSRGLLDAKTYQQAVWADLTYDSPALVRRQLAMATSLERPSRTQSAQRPVPAAVLAMGDVGPRPSLVSPISEEGTSQLRSDGSQAASDMQHLFPSSPGRGAGPEVSTSGRALGEGYTNPHKFMSKAWRETFWEQVSVVC
jgi:hypothetical protein